MFHYYSLQVKDGPTFFFKFGIEGEKRSFFRLDPQDRKNPRWVPIKIKSQKQSDLFYEYELEPEEGSSVTTTLKEQHYKNIYCSSDLIIEITDRTQGSCTPCTLSHIRDEKIKSYLASISQQKEKPQTRSGADKSEKEEPVKSSAPTKTGRSNPTSSPFFNKKYDRDYVITTEQRKLLEAHKTDLNNRRTDYSLLSYVCLLFCCFSQGFSKQEKIAQITRLLKTGTADSRVVENGYTGSIVLGMQ
ncbi:hypothetical protein Lnau_2890 [Legionella nautarum]|uniref:Uncharacterized protein n=1 Tax=Legionella nautarum TaxID=45070 RepID=A0A0W0WLP7_9GAMM|nr:hypothetical protein [Legionella nautarum]KTD33242.1 hypothetical protein Lnau_2890 [Legionella nautarum]